MDKLSKIKKILIEQNWTCSTCESFTSGLIASTLIKESGASKYFDIGLIVYSKNSKINLLNFCGNTISSDCLKAMFNYSKKLCNSDFIIASTGNAGPKPSENEPIGKYFIGIYDRKNNIMISKEYRSKFKNRQNITDDGVNSAINYFYKYINSLI